MMGLKADDDRSPVNAEVLMVCAGGTVHIRGLCVHSATVQSPVYSMDLYYITSTDVPIYTKLYI